MTAALVVGNPAAAEPAPSAPPATPPAAGTEPKPGAATGAGDAAPPSAEDEPSGPSGDAGSKPATEAPLLGEAPKSPPAAAKPVGVTGPAPAAGTAPAKPVAGAKTAAAGASAEGTEASEAEEVPKSEVYAEDWWSLARPAFEIHGYFRARAEFFNNFALNRRDTSLLWPQPADQEYVDIDGTLHRVTTCGDDPLNPESCDSDTNMGANMRFRIAPELHISDNLRVMSQIDMLDNLVAGSTPSGYANEPGADGGYRVVSRGGYTPMSFFSSTQWAPEAGVNSTKDSILVKRVWGEYSTPIGQVRFGRMPGHWGLGMYENAGDGFDSDWQTTVDALQITTGIKSWDLYFSFRLDFADEGANSASLTEQQGQPTDVAQRDDVDQYVFVLMRQQNAALARRDLANGLPVFNGGAYFAYRQQSAANDSSTAGESPSLGASNTEVGSGYVRRGAEAFIPDLWFQFMYEKFRLELEGIMIWGSMESLQTDPGTASDYPNAADPSDPGWDIRMFGVASEVEYRAVEDRLKLQFKFGWSSGDDDVDSLVPTGDGLQPQLTADRTYSTFRFHPDYRVDLILFRNIMTRVSGAYYFRPSVEYDFFRDPDGQKVGGGAALIWSRASEFVQTPGHKRDLGVELNLKLYYQARDGVLNDDPEEMGGFFTQLEYGVLFPLDGLGYMTGQQDDYAVYTPSEEPIDTETAHAVRWYLGILF